MFTITDLISFCANEWYNYLTTIYNKHGISVTIYDLSKSELTALRMYEICANWKNECFM